MTNDVTWFWLRLSSTTCSFPTPVGTSVILFIDRSRTSKCFMSQNSRGNVVKWLSLFNQNGSSMKINKNNSRQLNLYLKLTSFKFLNFDKVAGMLVNLLELKISVSSFVSCPSSEGMIPVIKNELFYH